MRQFYWSPFLWNLVSQEEFEISKALIRYFRIRVPKMLQPHLNTEISYPIGGIDLMSDRPLHDATFWQSTAGTQVFCLNASDWNMFGKLRVATSEELKRFPRESLCSQYETSVGVTFDGILFARMKWGEFQK